MAAFLAPDAGRTQASPLHYARDNRMPFLLAVGAQDFPVLYAQAYTMTAALRDTEGAVELLEIPAVDHFQINMRAADPEFIWVQRVKAWIQQLPMRQDDE